jgi:hypothetical protein
LHLVIGDVIAIAIGLALPELAVALHFGLAVYAIVPFREAARLLARRRSSSQQTPQAITATNSEESAESADRPMPSVSSVFAARLAAPMTTKHAQSDP